MNPEVSGVTFVEAGAALCDEKEQPPCTNLERLYRENEVAASIIEHLVRDFYGGNPYEFEGDPVEWLLSGKEEPEFVVPLEDAMKFTLDPPGYVKEYILKLQNEVELYRGKLGKAMDFAHEIEML